MRKIRIKIYFTRITLSQTMWLSILALLIVIMLISMVTTNIAYQQPTSSKETQTILTYSSNSQFDYVSSLLNNTVYNKTILRPGEGIIFKQIVENITGTHQFRFQISESAAISVTYSLSAIIQTGIWTKSYTLVPTQTTNTTGTRHTITESFPIDYRFFDTILTTINQETGITAPNPILLIRASISISARTADQMIVDSFQPEITMSLNQKTIEFSDMLSIQKSGSKTETTIIENLEIEEMRQTRLYTTIATIIILLGYLMVTKKKPTDISIVDQQLKKIKKKYGEWLVTAESNPVDPLSKIISIASMDELSRISEDLGKPMIYYQKNNSTNTFYVIDDEHIYQHELLMDEDKEQKIFPFFTRPTKKENKIFKEKEIQKQEKDTDHNEIVSKTVVCKHCHSPFTIEQEISKGPVSFQTPCPHCDRMQKITIGEKTSLSNNLKKHFRKKELEP